MLDAHDLESFHVLGVKGSEEDLNGNVSELLVVGNVGINGLLCPNEGKDGPRGVAALLHVTLDLPVELGII